MSNQVLPGRSCEGCTMCCILPEVEALDKPPLEVCKYCDVNVGCKAYDTRPRQCRDFYCAYLVADTLDEDWKPSKCGFLVTFEDATNAIILMVDPENKTAWRAPPYYGRIKQWADIQKQKGGMVLVWEGDEAVVIRPGFEKKVGKVGKHQMITRVPVHSPTGPDEDFIVRDRPG